MVTNYCWGNKLLLLQVTTVTSYHGSVASNHSSVASGPSRGGTLK